MPIHMAAPESSVRVSVVRHVAVAVVVFAVLAGCGGGSSKMQEATTTSATVATITKADYVSQANALCTTMNDRVKAIAPPGSDPQTVADAYDGVSSIVSGTLKQLRELPMPSGDEAQLQSIYAKVDALLADYAQFTAAIRAGDTAKATSLQAAFKADEKVANDASNAYGLTVCGS